MDLTIMYERAHLLSPFSNDTSIYSPVTLNSQWPTLGRLLLIIFLSSLGTIINGFFVAAFFVERSLNSVGNVFLACSGLADLIITSLVMPISAVVLLSGQWDTLPVCRTIQILGESSTYCYSMFFAMISTESYFRLCRPITEYRKFVSMRFSIISALIFLISFHLAGLGVYLELDYDYCTRTNFGSFYFRTVTSVIFHGIPFLMTIIGLLAASFCIRQRAQRHLYYRRSHQFNKDYSTTNVNLLAYIIYVIGWIPYLVIVYEYPNTSDSKYYHSVWVGICRSIFNGLLYSVMNKNFRRAFAHLFYYCCCKTTLGSSYSSRHRRALEYKHTTGDVRVHIMHQALCTNSPHRNASSTRETQEL